MNKEEMIAEILRLCKSNRNNPYCNIFWLADMIKEIVTNTDLKESDNET